MGGYMTTTGTTWDNLKLSFAGATEMTRNIIAHELLGNIFLPTNCTNGHEGYAIREWRPGRSHELSLMQWGEDMTTTGTTWDNLKLSFAGAIEMTRNIFAHELLGNIFFAHELHEWTRIVAMD